MNNEYNETLLAEQLEMEDNAQEYSPVLYKFTNEVESPYLDNILAMFYQGVYDNQLGIMQALNVTTAETELILVGVSFDDEGKPECYPVAKVLAAEDVVKYLSPDGKGAWFDPRNPSEVAAAKENMKPYNEAVVE